MRRRTYGGLVLSMVLAGCSASTSQRGDSSEGVYTTDAGVGLAVGRTETTDELVIDEETPLVPQSGSHILLVQLSAENTTDTKPRLPSPSQFILEADTETSDPYQVTFQNDPDGVGSAITDPVGGPLFPPTVELSEGSDASGWLIFSVPINSSDATLQLRASEGSVLNEWTLSFEIT